MCGVISGFTTVCLAVCMFLLNDDVILLVDFFGIAFIAIGGERRTEKKTKVISNDTDTQMTYIITFLIAVVGNVFVAAFLCTIGALLSTV